MKTIKRTLTVSLLAAATLSLTLSSCQKEFNPKTYAPKKPLPTFGGYGSSKDIEPASLVAYWPFSGSLADSISKTTGTATSTSFGTGVIGQGLQGSANGYVVSDVPAGIKSLKSFTISIWMKTPQNTGAMGLISIAHTQNFWGNFDIFFDNGGSATKGVLKVHAYNNAGSTSGIDAWEGGYSVDNPWNVWTQVLVTYDDTSGTVTVYYNGASVGTNTVAAFPSLDWSAAQKMVFGTLQFQTNPSLTAATGSQPWAANVTGTLDQVRVYNKVLSAPQISALYNLEKLGR